jgi:radical SAM protein with 4Fe4S-binding SPASM domain
MSTELGNLRRQPFAQVWNEAPGLQAIRDRDKLTQGNCGACRFKLVCGGCRAAALAIHGDPLAGDPTCWMFPDDRADAA